MWSGRRCLTLIAALWVVGCTIANPVRRSPGDLEARRRSAIDRSMIRLGRSSPPDATAADIREAFQRSTRRNNNFLRLGRSQPISISTDDLISLLKAYNDDDIGSSVAKRVSNFVRLGRDPKFIRFGRSLEDENAIGFEVVSDQSSNGYPQRKSRARDHFLRLGRDSEEMNESNEVNDEQLDEKRKKRSTDMSCYECQL